MRGTVLLGSQDSELIRPMGMSFFRREGLGGGRESSVPSEARRWSSVRLT